LFIDLACATSACFSKLTYLLTNVYTNIRGLLLLRALKLYMSLALLLLVIVQGGPKSKPLVNYPYIVLIS